MIKLFYKWYLPTFLLLNSLGLLWAGSILSANANSNARKLLAAGGFLLAALTFGTGLWIIRQPRLREKLSRALSTPKRLRQQNRYFAVLLGLFWLLAWLPAEKTGAYFYYFSGIYPLIIWLTFASGLGLFFSLLLRDDFSIKTGLAYWKKRKILVWVSLISLVIFSLLAVLIAALKLWQFKEPYWYGASVPLLLWQVYLIVFLALFAEKITRKLPKQADIILFFAIWTISAFFWASQPLQGSFFFTSPLPPNHEFYPFADLETFDRASQYALIGQGINNGNFFDRTLYISFLVYLHTFAGQNAEKLMSIQSAIFAIFPALIYLIGKQLHSRRAGLITSGLTAWRGVNALAAMAWINTSTSKHMLTDFPTAIGLAIFGLLLILWLKDPQKQWTKAAWAAGTLGLTSLLRPHVMAIFVIFLLAIFLRYWPRWRMGLAISTLGLTALLAGIAPWTILGTETSIMELYRQRILNVIRERYQPAPEQVPFSPGKAGLLLAIWQTQPPASPPPFIVSHFLNNLQTSALGLPLSGQWLTLRETVKESESVWNTPWTGEISLEARVMLSLGLALTALGIGAALQKNWLAGLGPLAIFGLYQAANGLSRTSGGRYIVPADWVVFLFLGLGVTVLLEALAAFFKRKAGPAESDRPAAHKGKQAHWLIRAASIVSCFGLVGGLIPLSEAFQARRYPPRTELELVEALSEFLPTLGLSETQLQQFVTVKNGVILEGRALYPRFFAQGAGMTSWEPFKKLEYARTVFLLIGPQPIHSYTRLAGPSPAYFPNSSDVIVLACENANPLYDVFDALAVILPGEKIVYSIYPERPLECPVIAPVCDNNKNCQ
jgi:hypothetical protein